MSYAVAVVSILKSIVPPRFTLMSVPKPWIEESPAPLTSHSDAGLPGSAFSVTIEVPNSMACAPSRPIALRGRRGRRGRGRRLGRRRDGRLTLGPEGSVDGAGVGSADGVGSTLGAGVTLGSGVGSTGGGATVNDTVGDARVGGAVVRRVGEGVVARVAARRGIGEAAVGGERQGCHGPRSVDRAAVRVVAVGVRVVDEDAFRGRDGERRVLGRGVRVVDRDGRLGRRGRGRRR